MYCSETVPIYKKQAKIGEIDSVRSIFNLIYLVEILQIKSEAIGAVFIFSFKDRRYYPKSNKANYETPLHGNFIWYCFYKLCFKKQKQKPKLWKHFLIFENSPSNALLFVFF